MLSDVRSLALAHLCRHMVSNNLLNEDIRQRFEILSESLIFCFSCLLLHKQIEQSILQFPSSSYTGRFFAHLNQILQKFSHNFHQLWLRLDFAVFCLVNSDHVIFLSRIYKQYNYKHTYIRTRTQLVTSILALSDLGPSTIGIVKEYYILNLHIRNTYACGLD